MVSVAGSSGAKVMSFAPSRSGGDIKLLLGLEIRCAAPIPSWRFRVEPMRLNSQGSNTPYAHLHKI